MKEPLACSRPVRGQRGRCSPVRSTADYRQHRLPWASGAKDARSAVDLLVNPTPSPDPDTAGRNFELTLTGPETTWPIVGLFSS